MSSIAGVKADLKRKPVDSRRVVVVLGSLVVTLTFMALILSLLQGQPITNASADSPLLIGAAGATGHLAKLLQIPPGLSSRRWRYIIIYQSGAQSGDAADLRAGLGIGGVRSRIYPNNRALGVNFHFVVDNARNGLGRPDGNIEVGTAWRQQASTAPYYSWPHFGGRRYPSYANVIGICLVGDVDTHPYSTAQVQALIRLIQTLRRQYHIPLSHVLMQWNIAGRPTSAEAAISRSLRRRLAAAS